jgi:hypothetical protein
MSNQNEQHDFRRALTQQGFTQPATQEGPSTWERIADGLREATDRSTGAVAAGIHTAMTDFVGRALLGELTSPPQLADKWQEQEKDKQQEPDKDIER